jgi:hypothetical protein
MAADHRPLDADEFISHFEEMPSRVPEEKARGRRGKTGTIMVYPEFQLCDE